MFPRRCARRLPGCFFLLFPFYFTFSPLVPALPLHRVFAQQGRFLSGGSWRASPGLAGAAGGKQRGEMGNPGLSKVTLLLSINFIILFPISTGRRGRGGQALPRPPGPPGFRPLRWRVLPVGVDQINRVNIWQTSAPGVSLTYKHLMGVVCCCQGPAARPRPARPGVALQTGRVW